MSIYILAPILLLIIISLQGLLLVKYFITINDWNSFFFWSWKDLSIDFKFVCLYFLQISNSENQHDSQTKISQASIRLQYAMPGGTMKERSILQLI